MDKFLAQENQSNLSLVQIVMARGCIPNAETLQHAILEYLQKTSSTCFSAALSYLENIDSLDNFLINGNIKLI